MTPEQAGDIRNALAHLDASGAHQASGESRPKTNEIFAPEHHAGALDPNVAIVLGARGAGKSFWAGVLGNEDTRLAAADAYPRLGLAGLDVRFGFTGLAGDGSVSRATIDSLVPEGQEHRLGVLFWRCVLLRAVLATVNPENRPDSVRTLLARYADPEEWEAECEHSDHQLFGQGRKLLVIFDALDAIAVDWQRLRSLLDALLEVTWNSRGFRAIRVKLFLRPDQMRDLGLRYVELPKLVAGATTLKWTGTDLYGMLFAKLSSSDSRSGRLAFAELLGGEGVTAAPRGLRSLRRWPPANDRSIQVSVFTKLAGSYMGRGHKKGRTYEWPLNHLADGHGEVTPRSFLTLAITAARFPPLVPRQVLSAEAIRHGLREASKVRVNQLELEFPWIKRVLAPLARLQVPCVADAIASRWTDSGTLDAIYRRARRGEFLPPFDPRAEGDRTDLLVEKLVRIGVLLIRADNRFDMPDLFRVAARLLKKGGVAPG